MSLSQAVSDNAVEPIRLQRFLAMAGAGSRRHCEELIVSGRVTVDRQTVRELGFRVVPDRQEVRLDGERVRLERKTWYLLNKPIGYLCTNSDPGGRPRVIDLFPRGRERLFTVGRLDEHSRGLLLVTNDGELAHRLAHPRFRVRKVYHVQVAGNPGRDVLEQLKRGLYFPEGRFKVAQARLVKTRGASSVLELELLEGQNREIRRLLAKMGHKVQRLERVAQGPLTLGDLPVGQYRPLAPQEIAALQQLVAGRDSRRGRGSRGAGRRS
ncbi:MAG TPA: pseudouridine synthase [Planctomycetaceae bacterium]|nr:pseudouridine synthase [Planctomycetaceae bacterium]